MFQPSQHSYYGASVDLAQIAHDLQAEGKGIPSFVLQAPGVNISFGEKPKETPWVSYALSGAVVLGTVGVILYITATKRRF